MLKPRTYSHELAYRCLRSLTILRWRATLVVIRMRRVSMNHADRELTLLGRGRRIDREVREVHPDEQVEIGWDDRDDAIVLAEALICEAPERGMTPRRLEERLLGLMVELELGGELSLDALHRALDDMRDPDDRRMLARIERYIEFLNGLTASGTTTIDVLQPCAAS